MSTLRDPEGPTEGRTKARSRKRWLKRMAVQLSGMLPEEPGDAAQVLDYMKELQVGFLADEPAGRRAGNVVTLESARKL